MEVVFTVSAARMDVWLISSCLSQTCRQVREIKLKGNYEYSFSGWLFPQSKQCKCVFHTCSFN